MLSSLRKWNQVLMLTMLYDITILEPSMSFHHDHMTVIVSCDLCDPSCDF